MRILQISDTHISAEHHDFRANREEIARLVAEVKPDLIINSGDISMNGCISPADFELAADWHKSLGVPVLSVPGNHDVGDLATIRADQVLDDERLERFRTLAGPDRWVHDIDGWRFIGLNAMLFATGHAEEEAQFQWLASAIQTSAKIAIFLHKPFFIDRPDEGARGYWTVVPQARQRLLDIIAGYDVRLVSSGHLHIAREYHFDGITHLWCPAASFVCGDIQEDLGGQRRIGYIDYTFTNGDFSYTVVHPDATKDLPLDPVIDRIYPSKPSVPEDAAQ